MIHGACSGDQAMVYLEDGGSGGGEVGNGNGNGNGNGSLDAVASHCSWEQVI